MKVRSGLKYLLPLLLAGCTSAPGPRPPVEDRGTSAPSEYRLPPEQRPAEAPAPGVEVRPLRREPLAGENSAVDSLLARADAAAAEGDWQRAGGSVERALRIDPRNPVLWNRLARIRLNEGVPEQAIELARRSNSYARGRPALMAENWRIIAQARRALGDAAGARAAEAEARRLAGD